jgi:predicted dehydrogenase
MATRRSTKKNGKAGRPNGGGAPRVRYAVVGLGYIAQTAVLPAFANARKNSELAALVSDDAAKLKSLGHKYKVGKLYSYERYADCLADPDIDAVFIALPNSLHRDYTEQSAAAGKHVLCEKPMAMTEKDCRAMVDACRAAGVKLMIGYRLHFEKANLSAVETVQSGRIGEPRLFDSVFTQDVAPGNIRLQATEGGPLYDIGIYCLNAARSLFRSEPIEVSAWHVSRNGDERFEEVPEMTGARLRFPDDRLATFVCSFGGAAVSQYDVVGTEGVLRVSPAFNFGEPLAQSLTIKEKTTHKTFPAGDQFAPELLEFSDCVLNDREPEPSGEEGLADVRVLQAIDDSARRGKPVQLPPFERTRRPDLDQAIHRPLGKKPRLIHVQKPDRAET